MCCHLSFRQFTTLTTVTSFSDYSQPDKDLTILTTSLRKNLFLNHSVLVLCVLSTVGLFQTIHNLTKTSPFWPRLCAGPGCRTVWGRPWTSWPAPQTVWQQLLPLLTCCPGTAPRTASPQSAERWCEGACNDKCKIVVILYSLLLLAVQHWVGGVCCGLLW